MGVLAGAQAAIHLTDVDDDVDDMQLLVQEQAPHDQEVVQEDASKQQASDNDAGVHHLCTEHKVEALLCDDDLEMTEFIEEAIRSEDGEVCDLSAENVCNVRADWHKRSVYDHKTNSMIDKMTVAKLINQKIPLTITKSGDRTHRVPSIPKFSSCRSANAIERSFNHGVGVIYLPEDRDMLKNGDYAMMLVKALPRVEEKECNRFAVVVCLLAFGSKKNVHSERV